MPGKIVIAGGGLGGLSAGAYLCQHGIPITLVEEQPHVGGYAIAFNRDEFVFDVALHAVPAGDTGQPFHNLVSQLGLEKDIQFLRLKEAFLIRLGKYQFQIPNNYKDFFNKLIREFPDESDGLKRLDLYLSQNAPIFFKVVNGDAGLLEISGKFAPKIPRFLKLSNMTTNAFLEQFTKNQKVKALLYQAAVFFGQPMNEFPAINFIIMFYLLFTTGMFTIHGGGQALTDALERKILENGGEIISGKQVVNIWVENNYAKSVELNDGSILSADAVISNINTTILIRKHIGEKYFKSDYLESLNALTPSISIIQLHLGLDCPVTELGIDQHIQVYFPDENVDHSINRQNDSLDIEGFSILAPGITDPNTDTNNERILSIVGGVSANNWLELNPEDYIKMKEKTTASIIEKLDILFTGIKKHIKTVDLATPRTFNRYTQNINGAILGYKILPSMHRTLFKISRFPIKNIFLASAWTSNLGGFMQSVKSGIDAGKKVKTYLNRQ